MATMQRLLKKIVKNDAMQTDPAEIYGWRVFALAASACFGAMSFGWDSSVIGGVVVMKPFMNDYGLGEASKVETANLTGNIVSTLQAGCLVGALIASPLTDRYGRKWCLVGVAAVILVGVAMQAASLGKLAPIFVGRFISGLGVGAASSINPLYVSENAPRAIRGLLTGMYQLFIVTGGMIAFWINYGAEVNLSGKTMYVFPLAIQGLPSLLLLVCMLFCNESPRWLARQDRWEESKKGLSVLRNLPETHPYLEDEFQEIVDQLQHERQLIGEATFMNLQKEMWTIKGNRNRALISIFLMICQQMTGTNAINTYAPTIFKNLGVTGRSTPLLSTGVYGIVKVLACICFLLFMADSLGRRRSLLWTSIAQGIAMFYIGLYVRISPPVDGQPVPGAGYMALVAIFLFAAFFQFGWGPACWIYASEIPTARLRSLNVALAAATQWLFNLIVARTVPNMLATVGNHGYGTYLIFGSFCFSMFFFVWFFVPETKGVSLEHMDKLFGVTEYDSDKNLAVDNASDHKTPVEVQVESSNNPYNHVRKESA
ncbi:MFS quinate transporter [Colletotrichum karsti]|uniref:MFS quinate transporter n=1 Tax=Colletotrichum karsti TaxID=1095194 RepID=A0A9P6I5W8_9PEZI|nr:MFS quinate transporter [Colletotrichum karsti]KAF9872575.1 MFS quinate transporter [Colletotrichum karsti]